MFLFKRRNGYYYVVYETTDKKRKNISTKVKTKAEALLFLTKFEKVLEKKQSEGFISITLKQLIHEFLKQTEIKRGWKTTKGYKLTLKLFISFVGDLNVELISNSDIRKYLESRFSSTSVYAARKDLINLKATFRFAIENNFIKSNPCVGIKQYRLPEKQPLYFSKTEFEILLSEIKEKEFKDLVTIAVNTGLRLNELLNLKWNQINLETKTITLDNREHITKTKRIRSIPINNNIFPIIKSMRSISKCANVFPNEERNKDIHVSQKFKSYIRKSKLNDSLHFHSLRHTFASWLIQSGVNIYNVSKLLGHSNIKTTEIYAHLRQDDLLESVNCLH